jgi:hypothetical protein
MLFLEGIQRMTLDIVIWAIVRVRGCRWWLMGAFWGTRFQEVVAQVQWAMAKGHTIGKMVTYQMTAETARLEMEDTKDEPRGGGRTHGPHGTPEQPGLAYELTYFITILF